MNYSDLEKMTVIRLREHAKQFPDIKGVSGMKKEELLKLLVDRLGIEVPPKKAKVSTPPDKSSLKKRIIELKEMRDAARAAKDKKKVEILRRKIHRMKRHLQKIA